MRLPRAAGVLLHPTSLPGPHGSGDLGDDAYRFVDWLREAGQSYWQMLPLGGIGEGNSPYMSRSAFAGNELLISLPELHRQGWLGDADLELERDFGPRQIDFPATIAFRFERLRRAAARFAAASDTDRRASFESFCETHSGWLDDYALFRALEDEFPGRDWCDWNPPLAKRDPAALDAAAAEYRERIDFWKFCQWNFFRQWETLRGHAHRQGIRIIGDAPIFVAYHSAETWARPELFELDDEGRQRSVAGVPPDYFSATGQRWGNPLYRWEVHRQQGFDWWIERIRHSLQMVDILRIDHFVGFTRYWEIPADEPTAERGEWRHAPGEALLEALDAALGKVPIIAEDLGTVTPEVHALRRKFELPGMCVLQFAWGRDGDENFLPHGHERDRVVYPGTHDNDTTLGWWAQAGDDIRQHLRDYLATDARHICDDLIRCAMASVADSAIVTIQDLLGMGSEHRMNHPGKADNNWGWRLLWSDIDDDLAPRMAQQCRLYGRQRKPET
jgi:4-alpha-glucanotransferase